MNLDRKYHIRHGETTDGNREIVITPESAGWEWSGLTVIALAPGESYSAESGEHELIILSLGGSCEIQVGAEVFKLQGRKDIWSAASDYLYIPIAENYTIFSLDGGRFAITSSKATAKLPIRYCPASETIKMIRGCGPVSRQVTNYSIGNELRPDHILVTEVYTPSGNWSSYPPHKHEEDTETERKLEEIYYYQIRGRQTGRDNGFGIQRIYPSPDFDIDVCVEVKHGDAVVMPYGYHGPSAAAPGYDLYYLNVMAGPASGAQWMVQFDPDHFWVNEYHDSINAPVDAALPFYPIEEKAQ